MKYTRRTPKRVFRKKTRTYRRKAISRSVRYSNLVSVKRAFTSTDFVTSTTWSSQTLSYKLDQLPAYSDFTNAFDMYRIMGIKITYLPFYNGDDYASALPSTARAAISRVYTVVDKSSQVAWSSEAAAQQYSAMRMVKRPLSPFSIYIRNPAIWDGIQGSAAVSYTSPKSRQWLSCDNPSIPHYGGAIGGVIPTSTAGATQNWSVVVTYYMQFKNAR